MFFAEPSSGTIVAIVVSIVVIVIAALLITRIRIVRQTNKYIVPTLLDPNNTYSWFRVVFSNTSLYFLMMFFQSWMENGRNLFSTGLEGGRH